MAISVCIATYNGEKFVREQLVSIIKQLKNEDEIIVVDDCSTDNTLKILREFDDSRIKIFTNNQNKGPVYSFNRLISLANNEIIFLSDQDDIWISNRVEIMINKLNESGLSVISSHFVFIDTDGKEIPNLNVRLKEIDSRHYIKNIIGIFLGNKDYFGCAMAFRKDKDLLKIILPIPQFIESHDIWIAMASNLICSNIHIEEKTLMRRIHENNVSLKRRGLIAQIKTRALYLISIIILLYRYYSNKLK